MVSTLEAEALKKLSEAFPLAGGDTIKWLDTCAHCGYGYFVHPGPSGRKVHGSELRDGLAPSEGDGTQVAWQRQSGDQSETRYQICWGCGMSTPTYIRRGLLH